MLSKILSLFSALTYISISCYLLYALIKRHNFSKNFILSLCTLSLITHVLNLGLNFSFYTSSNLSIASCSSFVMALILAINLVLIIRLPLINSLIFWLPLAAISILFAYFEQTYNSRIILQTGILFHIVFSLLFYILLALSCILALLLLWQDYQLKHKHLNFITLNFPSLQTMEQLLFILLANSWIILSLSLISGWIFLESLQLSQFIFKTIGACATWLIFAILFIGWRKWGWRSKITIILTLGSALLIVIAFLIINFLQKTNI